MFLQTENLEENGFVLIDELEHKDLLPFIQKYMKEKTRYVVFYYFFNVLYNFTRSRFDSSIIYY